MGKVNLLKYFPMAVEAITKIKGELEHIAEEDLSKAEKNILKHCEQFLKPYNIANSISGYWASASSTEIVAYNAEMHPDFEGEEVYWIDTNSEEVLYEFEQWLIKRREKECLAQNDTTSKQ